MNMLSDSLSVKVAHKYYQSLRVLMCALHQDQMFLSLEFCILVFRMISLSMSQCASRSWDFFMASPAQEKEHYCAEHVRDCTSLYVSSYWNKIWWWEVLYMLKLKTNLNYASPKIRSTSRCSSGTGSVSYTVNYSLILNDLWLIIFNTHCILQT